MNLKFYKMREGAKLPDRAHETDAGMDVFYCPKNGESVFSIPAGSSRVLPTGIKVEVPRGYMLEIKNKSGIASTTYLLNQIRLRPGLCFCLAYLSSLPLLHNAPLAPKLPVLSFLPAQ